MAEYKLYKNGNGWKALVYVGGGSIITVIGYNLQWVINILSTVFGFK